MDVQGLAVMPGLHVRVVLGGGGWDQVLSCISPQVTPDLPLGPESTVCAKTGSRRREPGAVSPEDADHPKALPEAVETLKRQVASLTAANRRLQNEARRNSRRWQAIA